MVEKITKVIAGFRQLQLKMEEYVCLKVISMVSAEGKTKKLLFYPSQCQWNDLNPQSLDCESNT